MFGFNRFIMNKILIDYFYFINYKWFGMKRRGEIEEFLNKNNLV